LVAVLAFLFDTPLWALSAAAGAAALPILIHLLNRKRFRVITWAAMRFLLAAQRKNIRRMRLEQLVLLAVRTLLVVLLVLAMASVMPWAEEIWLRLFPNSAGRAAAVGRRTHKILVLDGSFSMALKVGDTTCFERARGLARRLVRESAAGDGFSVLLMAAPPRRVVPEPSDDAGKVAAEIEALRLPHGNADLTATLKAIEDMLRRSPGKFAEREIYFLTDLQRSNWLARQSGDPAALFQRIQAQARMTLVDLGQDGVTNSAVTNVALGVPLATVGVVTPITATLHHYGAEHRNQVRVELLVGRGRGGEGGAPFELHVANQMLVDLAPGENTLNFPYKFTAPGEYAVQIRMESDALELDDTRSAIIRVKENVPVMLVNGKPAAELYDRATEWLQDALNPFQGGAIPQNVSARPRTVTESQFADAVLGDLTAYDCVFLCDVARLGVGEIHRLEMHLRGGGGVVFCLGPRIDLEAYNRLVYRNGEGILPGRLVGRQQAAKDHFYNFFAEEKSYHEPPLAAFAADRDRIGLLGARFREYVRVEPAPHSSAHKILSFMPELSAVSSPGNDAPRATGSPGSPPGGDPALIDWPRYRGRVLLFTSTVNADWTTWPISPSFPALMQEVLLHAVTGRLREQSAVVGEVLEECLPPGSAGLDVTVYTPDGKTETSRTETLEEAGVLRWSDTDASGLYRATIGQHPQDYLFAVNVPTATDNHQASESDLTRTNQSELQSSYPGWDFQLVTDLRQVTHFRSNALQGTELPSLGSPVGMGTVVARWLLLFMMLLLVVEVILAWRFGHYAKDEGGRMKDEPQKGAPGANATRLAISSFILHPSSLFTMPLVVAAIAVILFLTMAGVLAQALWTGDFLGFLPERMRGMVEARLGIPPPAAGEGTRWHLEFTPYLWDGAADPWLVGTLAVILAALILAIYLHEGRTARPAYKLLLAGLRLFFVLLALVVLLPQLRLWFEREAWPDVAILIDDSRSMSVSDRYQDPTIQEAAARLAHSSEVRGQKAEVGPERLQLVQTLLSGHDSEWLQSLVSRRRVKIHLYRCSDQVTRIADVTDPQQVLTASQEVQALRAVGERSRLGAAVRQVLNDFRGSSLAALVMLTDGVTTDGEDLGKASRYAAQMGVPLFFVGLGEAHPARHLRLHDLQVEDVVYVNDRLVFEARLTSQGYENKTVTVRLCEKDKEGRLKELARQRVTGDPEGKPVKFRLVHQPTEPGERAYVLDVAGVETEGENRSPADTTRLERTVLVRDAKQIKVLYIEGYARYEYRFVKHLLEREVDSSRLRKSVTEASTPNRTIDLKVLLLDADSEYASEDRSALADFPTREELNAYDVVILGDVDPKDKKVGDKNLQHLADFVKERGGGLLMIAGPRFSPHAYKETPLRDILPVRPTEGFAGSVPPERDYAVPFHPELTAEGRFHPIFRFVPDEAENTAIWSRLPDIYWWSEGYRLQPAAEVLMVRPTMTSRGASARPSPGGPSSLSSPLLVQQFVGAGRSMFFGFEETWRWRYREGEVRFNQFWINTVRYLARNRLGRIELRLDRQTPYRRGEPIKLTVRFPDDTPPPSPETRVEVLALRTPLNEQGSGVRGQGSASQLGANTAEIEKDTLRLAKVEGSRATYEGLLTRTPEGEYRFSLSEPAAAGPKPHAEARVLPPPGEMEQLQMNQADMEGAAAETHGRFYTLADADRLPDDLPTGTRIALQTPQPPRLLWNHFTLFALALGLLGTEWMLRKRKYLL
jgi:hypothetical protein